MRSFLLVLSFIAVTFFCWGVYGPVLHEGQHAMGESSLRPFICVGVAYFVIAVVVPLVLLYLQGEKGAWTTNGAVWSLGAGAAGAVGALGIILAFKFRGSPVYVMPLVFGCAPVVNTLMTMWMTKTYKEAGPLFYGGVGIVAVGAAGVMCFKPTVKPADNVKISTSSDGTITIVQTHLKDGTETSWKAADEEELRTSEDLAKAYELYRKKQPLRLVEFIMIPFSIALTALCWGCYGPTLHKGQMKMEGSRLRPLLCVGLAYFGIAVLVPLLMLSLWREPGGWFYGGHISGPIWSLLGGAAGALGALGIIMAFNYGGKPIYVMPLVFGCAPLVNTGATMLKPGTYNPVSLLFYVSLLLVIVGAVTVLIFAPKAPHKPAGAEKKDSDHKAEAAPKEEAPAT
jgi:hypothetical protein